MFVHTACIWELQPGRASSVGMFVHGTLDNAAQCGGRNTVTESIVMVPGAGDWLGRAAWRALLDHQELLGHLLGRAGLLQVSTECTSCFCDPLFGSIPVLLFSSKYTLF